MLVAKEVRGECRVLGLGKLAAGVAVSMGEEPCTDDDGDAAYDEEFVADNERWQNHEGYAAQGDGNAGGDAADDDTERGVEDGGQAEQEEAEADPDDAAQAGEFGGEFAGGVFLRRAELGTGANLLPLADERIFDFRISIFDWGNSDRHVPLFDSHLPLLLQRWWQ